MKTQIRWVTIFLASLVFVLLQLEGQPAHGATPIESGETHSGEAGDRVLVDVDKTGGQQYFNTEMLLIDPDQIDEANTQPNGDLLDHILLKTGLYTIVVQDAGLDEYGSYNITLLNLTAGPLTSSGDPDGGPIASGETLSGGIIASRLVTGFWSTLIRPGDSSILTRRCC